MRYQKMCKIFHCLCTVHCQVAKLEAKLLRTYKLLIDGKVATIVCFCFYFASDMRLIQ